MSKHYVRLRAVKLTKGMRILVSDAEGLGAYPTTRDGRLAYSGRKPIVVEILQIRVPGYRMRDIVTERGTMSVGVSTYYAVEEESAEMRAERTRLAEQEAPTAGHPARCSCGECIYNRTRKEASDGGGAGAA